MRAKSSNSGLRNEDFEKLFSDEFLLTVDHAALYLSVSLSTLNHWRSDGKGPAFVKLCGSSRGAIRYRIGDIRNWVSKNTFSSTADAELMTARYNVADVCSDWAHPHPFIARSSYFLVDSATADAETFKNIFFDPFVKIRWLQVEKALAMPWLHPGRRTELLGLYLNSKEGTGAAARVADAYAKSLRNVPEQYFGSHPDLTLQSLQQQASGYPVEYFNC